MSHNALQSKVSASRLQRGASGERKTTEALARLHSAREQAYNVRENLQPGQYFRVLREIIAARKRRRAVNV